MMTPLEALRRGGKPALARALAQIERAPQDPENLALLDAAYNDPRGPVAGITGPPGVGKSSLIGALIKAQRAQGRGIGVIAVDPSSRLSGGALLGDRARLSHDPQDQGVFMRSMAARDALGGVAALTFPAATLMAALYDLTLIETVGVGQSEMDIADIAAPIAVCAQPGAGDSLQFMKAGLMEIPDIILIAKADLGAPARKAAADLRAALAHIDNPPPVLSCSALTGEGVEAALAALSTPPPDDDPRARLGRWAQGMMRARFGVEGAAALARHYGEAPPEARPFCAMAARAAAMRAHLRKGLDAS